MGEVKEPLLDGAYVRGLLLEGARWDLEKGCLATSRPALTMAKQCDEGQIDRFLMTVLPQKGSTRSKLVTNEYVIIVMSKLVATQAEGARYGDADHRDHPGGGEPA